jgi:capsular polysaccharide synthesis protein
MEEKIVWFLWLQGLEEAPEIVKICHRSWIERCGWDVMTIDESKVREFATLGHGGVAARQSPNHRGDLLRLDLLTHRGGVWVDATCFCVSALDDWLPDLMQSGFFAYDSPAPDRPLCSWFIASRKGHPLARVMLDKMYPYWNSQPFRPHGRPERLISRMLNRTPRTRALWFSRPVRDWARIAPYFAFHYGFEHLLRGDSEFAAAWEAVPKVASDGPHGLYRRGPHVPPADDVRIDIEERRVPLYKTTWKFDWPPVPGSSLDYLLRTL